MAPLAVAAADPVDSARTGVGPQGTDERCSTELRAGHGRMHLRRVMLGGATTSSGTGRVASAVALPFTYCRRRVWREKGEEEMS